MTFTESNTVEALVRDVLRGGVTHHTVAAVPRPTPESLPRLEELRTMLEENVREWTAEWVAEGRELGLEQGRAEGRKQGLEQGRAEGREQGRAEERTLLCRMAARKFDAATAQRLAAALAEVTDADRLAEVGDWIIECGTAADLLKRLPDVRRPRTEATYTFL